nr:hypothetical protein [uncultured Dongia sp.]
MDPALVAKPPNPDYLLSMFSFYLESVALLRWRQHAVSVVRPCSRLAARMCAALCLAGWLLAAHLEPALAQDTVGAKGQLFDDFGRLTLDWAKAPVPDVEIALDDTEMTLRFARPVSLDPAAVRANLKAYIRSASLSADARTLSLALKKPVTYRLDRANGRLQLDLAQPGEAVLPNKATGTAQATPTVAPIVEPAEKAVETAAAPATPAPTSGPNLKLRSGEHSGYSRLAIDWPGVDFTLQQVGDKAIISFAKPGRLDTATRLPPRLRGVKASSTATGGLALELQLLPNVGLNAFRNGGTVVIDLVDGKPAAAPAAPAPTEPAASVQAEAPAVVVPPEVAAIEAVPAEPAQGESALAPIVAEAPTASDRSAPKLQSEPPVGVELPKPADVPAVEIAPPVVVTKEPAITVPAKPPAPVEIAVTAAPADNGAVLDLTFPKATGLAVFKRGDALWLVFDRPGPIDLAELVKAAPALSGITRVETPYATVLRLPTLEKLGGGDAGAKISGDGRHWQISLGRGRDMRPAKSIEQRRESLANGGASLLLQATRPGPVINLSDPEAGDAISIIPLLTAGSGIADGAAWPDFRVLPSFQGVVVVPISDRTRVEALPNGVVVTTDGVPGGGPSPVVPKPISETEPPPAEPEAPPLVASAPDAAPSTHGEPSAAIEQVAMEPVEGIFDLPRWRRGGEANFSTDEAALREAIDEASNNDKPLARLALAQFHFAHGRYPEALDDMVLLDKRAEDGDKDVLALRGATLALAERGKEAHADLDRPEMEDVPEGALFRGYVAAREQDWPAAAKVFAAPIPLLDDYPKSARMLIRRAAAEALLRSGNSLPAQAFLDAMKLDMPSVEDQAFHDYLTGLQLAQAGNKEEAMKAWAALADSPVDEVHARSQFDLTELQLAEGKIDTRKAATQLEALRFVWRGTDFEFDLLDRLGGLYIAADLPRKGLVTLRQAATNFPKNPKAKHATEEMSKAFYDLYLGDKADRLAPLTAVALYDEFRELTPSGPDGDRMVTALADRLVKVDLLDGASRLLENQINKRLSGLDKAKAGTRLAAIRLLDGKPDLALDAIKASEVPDIPPDVTAQRRRLQGRALFETGDTLKGMAMVRDDNSLDGLWLKADLSWRMREWSAAATALENLIAGETERLQSEDPSMRPPADLSVDPAAALAEVADDGAAAAKRDAQFTEVLAPLILNQAIALSLSNDRAGLRMLGKAHGVQMAKGPYATAFETLTSPTSSLSDSIGAAMKSVDQLGAFVDDYRTRLKAESLSAPETTPDAAPPPEMPPTTTTPAP